MGVYVDVRRVCRAYGCWCVCVRVYGCVGVSGWRIWKCGCAVCVLHEWCVGVRACVLVGVWICGVRGVSV